MNSTIGLSELSQVIQTAAVVFGGAIILVKMGRMMGAFEQIGKRQAMEITEIKSELKDLSKLLTTVAVQKNELNNLREQFVIIQRQLEEIRITHTSA